LSVAIAWVLDFILHIPYVVGACALPSILLSLSDIWYIVNRRRKRRRRRFRASASTFRLIWISLLHIVVKRVRNSTLRFRCVFGSTEGPLNVRRILRIWLCAYLPHLNYGKLSCIRWCNLLGLSAASGVHIETTFRRRSRLSSSSGSDVSDIRHHISDTENDDRFQYWHLTRLIARENCIKYSRRESSKTCIIFLWVLPSPRLSFARFGWFMLGKVTLRYVTLRFPFYSSHCIYSRRMHTYQHTAFTVLDRYYILYAAHKSDAGVGLGRRCRFLDWYGFRFSTTLWKMFIPELRDSVLFSVVQTVMEFKRITWV
jgi:hypothetical protein